MTITTEKYESRVHLGYMAGLTGENLDEDLARVSNEYSEAYLIGCQDREAGVKADSFLNTGKEDLPFKSGDMVTIKKGTMVKTIGKDPKPAGRTHKVKVNHTISSCTAYFEYGWEGRTLHRPLPAIVVWAGAGGYWSEAAMHEVEKI